MEGRPVDLAEALFLKLRRQCSNYERCEEMDLLADFGAGTDEATRRAGTAAGLPAQTAGGEQDGQRLGQAAL